MNDLIDNSKEEKKQKKSARRRDRELTDIRFVLQSPQGRRFYWRLMAEGRVFHDAFASEMTNRTNYNLGAQAISRTFLNDLLEASPNSYAQMQGEQRSEAESDKVQEDLEEKQNGVLS